MLPPLSSLLPDAAGQAGDTPGKTADSALAGDFATALGAWLTGAAAAVPAGAAQQAGGGRLPGGGKRLPVTVEPGAAGALPVPMRPAAPADASLVPHAPGRPEPLALAPAMAGDLPAATVPPAPDVRGLPVSAPAQPAIAAAADSATPSGSGSASMLTQTALRTGDGSRALLPGGARPAALQDAPLNSPPKDAPGLPGTELPAPRKTASGLPPGTEPPAWPKAGSVRLEAARPALESNLQGTRTAHVESPTLKVESMPHPTAAAGQARAIDDAGAAAVIARVERGVLLQAAAEPAPAGGLAGTSAPSGAVGPAPLFAGSPAAPAPAPAAMPPAPLPSIDVAPGAAGWADALGNRVTLMAGQGMQRAEIQLNPADLGPVRVQVSVDDGTAAVTFHAQHPLTRDALEQALPRLRDMLGEQGLTLGDASVSDHQPSREDASERDAAPWREATSTDEAPRIGPADGTAAARAATPSGLVDLFA